MRCLRSALLGLSAVTVLAGHPTVASAAASPDRDHFEIEGVKLGMTLPQLLAATKQYGAPKITRHDDGNTFSVKTADLRFDVSFSKAGALNRMDIYSRVPANGSSTMLKRATEAWGKPTEDGDALSWTSRSGTVASYYDQGDTVEIVAK